MTREELKKALGTAWRRLRGGKLTPARAALSVGVGLLIGVTPLWGAHIFLVLAVCLPLGLDAPVSYLAANVSIPPIAPFLWLAEVEIGAWLLGGRALPLDIAAIKAAGPWTFARELALGTALFAPAVATLGGALTFACVAAVRRARGGRDADLQPEAGLESGFEDAVRKVADRYAAGRRAAYHYARGKMLGDPVVRRLWELAAGEPLGHVVDVGAGRGQLAILLALSGGAARVLGFDWDETKVRDAELAGGGLDVSFEARDARSASLPECDTVLLIDVLHYLTPEEQDDLLLRAARSARARVLIREVDPERGVRSTITRAQEAITTWARYNRGARVCVRPIACIARVLDAEGFDVSVEPCWGATPFSNVLVVGRRRGRSLVQPLAGELNEGSGP